MQNLTGFKNNYHIPLPEATIYYTATDGKRTKTDIEK